MTEDQPERKATAIGLTERETDKKTYRQTARQRERQTQKVPRALSFSSV